MIIPYIPLNIYISFSIYAYFYISFNIYVCLLIPDIIPNNPHIAAY